MFIKGLITVITVSLATFDSSWLLVSVGQHLFEQHLTMPDFVLEQHWPTLDFMLEQQLTMPDFVLK